MTSFTIICFAWTDALTTQQHDTEEQENRMQEHSRKVQNDAIFTQSYMSDWEIIDEILHAQIQSRSLSMMMWTTT